ncbi:MAG: hypothetical protein ABTQ29_02860 [Siculibacillus sp.]
MSAIRPRPRALLVVAHGDGGTDPRDETVRLLAERLARRLDVAVDWATLKRPETFAAARARLAAARPDGGLDPVAVYPLFMSSGFFVRVKLPKLLAENGFVEPLILPVFGLDPGLVDLVEHRLRSIASMQGGLEPKDLAIAMVAHGSGSGDTGSRRAAEALVADLGYRLDAHLHLGFLEEAPFFEPLFAEVAPAVVVGLFVSAGTHAIDDVAALCARTPSVRHHVDAVGRDAGVADLVERALTPLLGPTEA